jgi:hypothetical protein
MSAKFDASNEDQALHASHVSALGVAFPFSLSLWVYFESLPDEGTQVVWWYGDKNSSTKWVRLEMDNANQKLQVAAGSGYASISAVVSPGTISTGAWHLVTFVAEYADDIDLLTHRLFVDDQNAATQTATVTDPSPPQFFDRVSLARIGALSANPTLPASCWVEQVALWGSALAEADHDEMWSSTDERFKVGGAGLPRSPNAIGTDPDVGYWHLAGHYNHDLTIANSQNDQGFGELRNEAQNGTANFKIDAGSPRWSAITPAVFYPYVAPAGTPPPRKPKVRAGRMSPQFFIWQKPELFPFWSQSANHGRHPIWDDPYFIVMARVRPNIGGDDFAPPGYEDATYLPNTYITNVARRVGDWFEYQNFWTGRGSEGGGLYEGWAHIQTLGYGGDGQGQEGGNAIPLQLHPRDQLKDTGMVSPRVLLDAVYCKNGRDLLKVYCENFWPALKRELQRRKRDPQDENSPHLAFPKRMHWGFESSPKFRSFVFDGGNWPWHEFTDGSTTPDSRWGSGSVPGETVATDGATPKDLYMIWDDPTPYDRNEDFDVADNDGFRPWALGWSIHWRDYALAQSIFSTVKTVFPDTRWSNNQDFVCDNPNFAYVAGHVTRVFNTKLATLHADFSSPNLYQPDDARIDDFVSAGYGATRRSAFHAIVRKRMDACARTNQPMPMAPWITGVGSNAGSHYIKNDSDHFQIIDYAWRRGVNEFLLFAHAPIADIDATYRVCRNFVNTLRTMPYYSRDRTMRHCRVWR